MEELHVYLVPLSCWVQGRNLATKTIENETISLGFVRYGHWLGHKQGDEHFVTDFQQAAIWPRFRQTSMKRISLRINQSPCSFLCVWLLDEKWLSVILGRTCNLNEVILLYSLLWWFLHHHWYLFLRVLPELNISNLRIEIEAQLDNHDVPDNFIFIRNVGRHFAMVSQ